MFFNYVSVLAVVLTDIFQFFVIIIIVAGGIAFFLKTITAIANILGKQEADAVKIVKNFLILLVIIGMIISASNLILKKFNLNAQPAIAEQKVEKEKSLVEKKNLKK